MSACLSTIEHKIIINLEKANYPKKPYRKTSDTLKYWRAKVQFITMLLRLAREIIAIAATSAPSERVLSSTGTIILQN
jgi:hypothetical protein